MNAAIVVENDPELVELIVGDPPEKIQYKKDYLAYDVDIKRIKIYVYVCHGQKHDIVKAKIVDDHYLQFKANGKKKKVLIASQPAFISRRKKVIRKETGLIWGCGFLAEATHDLGATKINIVAVENILKLTRSITDTEIPRVLAEKVKGKKSLMEYIPWVLFFLTNLAWMYYSADLVGKMSKLIG